MMEVIIGLMVVEVMEVEVKIVVVVVLVVEVAVTMVVMKDVVGLSRWWRSKTW